MTEVWLQFFTQIALISIDWEMNVGYFTFLSFQDHLIAQFSPMFIAYEIIPFQEV